MNIKSFVRLAVFFCLMFLGSSALAGTYSGGDGTASNPYQLATGIDIQGIGEDPNDWDKHFILIGDPNLAEYTGKEFNIIGSRTKKFIGSFDGDGHTIYNFSYTSTGTNNIGLFSYIGNGGEIKNLVLKNVSIDTGTGDYVGSLVGDINNGIITNCHSMGSVKGDNTVGGLVGYSNTGSIVNSHSDVSVTGREDVGGLAGESSRCNIRDSYSTGIVAGYRYVGGLVGVDNECYITNCYSTADVSGEYSIGALVGFGSNGFTGNGRIRNCYSKGNVKGKGYIGGLVGNNNGAPIINSYSSSSVTGTGYYYIGGLVGKNEHGSITNSYSIGDVTGTDYYVGGLVGENKGSLTNCYSSSSVIGLDYVGGLCGKSYDVPIIKCYFLDAYGLDNGYGTPLTDSDMRQQSGFVGWDFLGETVNGTSQVWQMPTESGYPVLSSLNGYNPVLSGSGTKDSPYLISNPNDLGAIYHYGESYFSLVNDIDLSGIKWSTAVIPVFIGSFEGNGFVIRNLLINGGDYVGLFGYLESDAIISRLALENVSVIGRGYFIGGLAGFNDGGSIKNSYSMGHITGTSYWVGGVLGCNHHGSLTNCFSIGEIKGKFAVGGLLGENDSGTVTDCYSMGSATGGERVGGLVGENFHGSITNSYSNNTATGTERVGGLVGGNYSATYNPYDSITNCYSTGAVNGAKSVGGLVGYDFYGRVTNSYFLDTAGPNNGYGNPLTDLTMRQQSSFVNWDFLSERDNGDNEIWRMCVDGVDFPRLSWEFARGGDFACGDGVDILDLQTLAVNWLVTEDDAPATFNYSCDGIADGKVDLKDFAVFSQNWLR